MKDFLNVLGGLLVLWLCIGLPMYLIWLFLGFDLGIYWILCIVGMIYFLLISKWKK
jgi:hypothetical protein